MLHVHEPRGMSVGLTATEAPCLSVRVCHQRPMRIVSRILTIYIEGNTSIIFVYSQPNESSSTSFLSQLKVAAQAAPELL